MTRASIGDRLLRIAFAALGDIEEWRLGDARRAAEKGWPRRSRVDALDGAGIVFVDVTVDARTGGPVCLEVNGPNAVGSDALTGDSRERAGVEARAAVRHAAERGHLVRGGRLVRPVVVVQAHQHWSSFRTGGEFYPRVGRFAEALARVLPADDLELRGPREPLGDERLSVVLGDVPSVAAHLDPEPDGSGFRYRGRPVVFLGNPNLAIELVRTGKLRLARGRFGGADLRAFHADRLLHVVHDKTLQQALFSGTGVRPLHGFEASSRDEAVALARAHLARGPVVLKPNGGSGGVGVQVVVPGLGESEVAARVDAVLSECRRKHGENVESFAYPIRGFEFVRSTGFPMEDGEHLWDLRFGVLFEDGLASVYPVSLRLAPLPFDERSFHLDRDRWITNVSGRTTTLLRSGLDDRVLEAVGMTPERVDVVASACTTWTARAWDGAVRDAGPTGVSYEDACEAEDAAFYPHPGAARP